MCSRYVFYPEESGSLIKMLVAILGRDCWKPEVRGRSVEVPKL